MHYALGFVARPRSGRFPGKVEILEDGLKLLCFVADAQAGFRDLAEIENKSFPASLTRLQIDPVPKPFLSVLIVTYEDIVPVLCYSTEVVAQFPQSMVVKVERCSCIV